MFSGNTDPIPYITAVYLIGFFGIYGFALWIIKQRQSCRKMLTALKHEKKD